MIKLERPLVVFDLETTGTNIQSDRIIELSYIKLFPNGEEESHTYRIKPTTLNAAGQEVQMHIPEQASQVHGIYDDDLKDCPTFRQIAPAIDEVISNCDLAGYNSNHFDVPLLAEELMRAGVNFSVENRHFIDAFTLFTRKEPRNLTAAYKFYCGKDLTDAHSALGDTRATLEVLLAQIERYQDLPDDVAGLATASAPEHKPADLAGKLAYNNNNEIVFTFGKYRDRPVKEVIKIDPGYYNWLMNGDFPRYTKNVLATIKANSR